MFYWNSDFIYVNSHYLIKKFLSMLYSITAFEYFLLRIENSSQNYFNES